METVNIKAILKDFDGSNLRKPDFKQEPDADGVYPNKEFTLADACIDSLNATFKGEELSFDEKFKRFTLGLKISEANGADTIELEPMECTKLMELISKGFPPIVVGRAAVLLGKALK